MINARQIAIRTGGLYANLEALLNQTTVLPMPFVETQQLTAAAAQFALVSSAVLGGNIARGSSSAASAGGIVAAPLATAVGVADLASLADANGAITNLIALKDNTTNDPILDANGREIRGLLQCSAAVVDGAAIGAPGSENLQISFVVFDAAGALALVPYTGTLVFQVNRLYALRHRPSGLLLGSNGGGQDVIDPGSIIPLPRRVTLTVTTAVDAAAVINVQTGAVTSGAGALTAAGDTVALPGTATIFNANPLVWVGRNGVVQMPVTEVSWVSATQMSFAAALAVGEVITVEVPAHY
jgi:hypothetical protein